MVTREELDAAKAELRAVDARPIKKVMEAKARKHKRLQVPASLLESACCCLHHHRLHSP